MQYSNKPSLLNIPNIDPYIRAPLFCIILIWLPVTSSSFRALIKQLSKRGRAQMLIQSWAITAPNLPLLCAQRCSDPKVLPAPPNLTLPLISLHHVALTCPFLRSLWSLVTIPSRPRPSPRAWASSQPPVRPWRTLPSASTSPWSRSTGGEGQQSLAAPRASFPCSLHNAFILHPHCFLLFL